MTEIRIGAGWGGAAVLLLLTPALLTMGVPLAIGGGWNIFAVPQAALALLLCTPALLVLGQYLKPKRAEPISRQNGSASVPAWRVPW